jgi:hypothetical protein
MTHKMRILTVVLLTLAMVGFCGAVAAQAAATPASLTWAPTTSLGTYDYGTVDAGTTKSVTFTLTNAGDEATGPLRIALSGPSAFTITQDGCSDRSLEPNTSCTDTVQYAPTIIKQSERATLSASGESASLTLTGLAGVPDAPYLTLSPGTFQGGSHPKVYEYNFGKVASAQQMFTVFNDGHLAVPRGLRMVCFSKTQHDCYGPLFMAPIRCEKLEGNGESCTLLLSVTLPKNCPVGQEYELQLKLYGNLDGISYIDLLADVECPG